MKKIILFHKRYFPACLLLLILFSFSVRADFWTQKANFPGAGREIPFSFVIGNKAYVGGGRNASSVLLYDFWEYDPAANAWTQLANFPGTSGFLAVGFAINNKGYAGAGGFPGFSNDFWEYDVPTNSWIAKANFGGTSRWGEIGFAIGSKGYVGCGIDISGLLNDFWEWDQQSNTWTQVSSLPGNSRRQPVAFTINGMGYVCTGNSSTGFLNDTWEYNPATNTWSQKANLPAPPRQDASAFSICGYGYVGNGEIPLQNDFWQFNPSLNQWFQKANVPGNALDDCGSFSINNLGYVCLGYDGSIYPTSLWEYTPDSVVCTATASFTALNSVCPGTCTSFINLSSNSTSFQWFFPGANPDTSTDSNPQNICYAAPGSYNVQLIATNANGSDTLLLTNYITVFPSPPPQSITQNGDTLFALAGSASYQWYFNGNIINGATDYFYLAATSGNYNVVATDADGCEVEAAIFDVIAGILSTVDRALLTVFPNPVGETLFVKAYQLTGTTVEISIYNILGEKVLAAPPLSFEEGPGGEADVSSLPPGLYYIEITLSGKTFRSKFLKSAFH
jgi:N-acetylneuraminic acid mutarotase